MKTTKLHFELFQKECERWIEKFGLKGWRYEYFHKEDIENSRASYSLNLQGRVCSFYLNPKWNQLSKITDRGVRESAFHEVCHVLLVRLVIIAQSRYINSDEITEETHAIIRTLENVVFYELEE